MLRSLFELNKTVKVPLHSVRKLYNEYALRGESMLSARDIRMLSHVKPLQLSASNCYHPNVYFLFSIEDVFLVTKTQISIKGKAVLKVSRRQG